MHAFLLNFRTFKLIARSTPNVLGTRMPVRYGTPQFLLRSTVRWYGTFCCSGTGTVRWYGTPFLRKVRVRYVATLFEFKP